jgi:ribosomal protein S18 acetylase RimI-like enzyme
MLDKSIAYKNIIMKIDSNDVLKITEPVLPEGFSFRLFVEGDEANWARIETSVLEFETEDDARSLFTREYLPFPDELKRRCVFVVNKDGLPVATTTAWFGDHKAGCQASVHWVSVCPGYQGLGLGKAIVKKALTIFQVTEPGEDIWLHTQTWSHVAVRLYRSLGFYMMKTEKFTVVSPCDRGTAIQLNDYEEAMDVLKTVYDDDFWNELARTAR